jgi:hypothetical protein
VFDLSQYDIELQSDGSVSQGFARGVAAERARIRAIVSLPESACDPALSCQLALETGMTVSEVQAAIRAGHTSHPAQEGAEIAADAPWCEIVERHNQPVKGSLMIPEVLKKLLSPKSQPTRAAVEKALAEAQAEYDRASKSVAELTRSRRDVLLKSDDSSAAAHDEAIAREQRAQDRAQVLLEELEVKLQSVAERERQDVLSSALQAAEENILAGVAALERYHELSQEIRGLLASVDAGQCAADAFNRAHPEEKPLAGPEMRVRWLPPTQRQELSREPFSAWAYDWSGDIIPEKHLEHLHQNGATRGVIRSPQSQNNAPVTLREFEKVRFIPAQRIVAPTPLAKSVVLPALRSERLIQEEEEILPISRTQSDAA